MIQLAHRSVILEKKFIQCVITTCYVCNFSAWDLLCPVHNKVIKDVSFGKYNSSRPILAAFQCLLRGISKE